MSALNLAAVTGNAGSNELVPNTHALQSSFEQGRELAVLRKEALGEFRAVVGLYTLNGKGKPL